MQYALHKDNGDIFATDSHRAIHLKGMHGFKDEFLVNPRNHMVAKGTYPALEPLIANNGRLPVIVLNKEQIKLWFQLFKSINQTIKIMKETVRLNYVTLHIHKDYLEVEFLLSKTRMTLPFERLEKPNGLDVVSFGASYMVDALEAHFKLHSEQLTISFNGNMRPFLMDDESKVKTVILPVRIGSNN